MKHIISIILLFIAIAAYSQSGVRPNQIQGSPYKKGILQATGKYYDHARRDTFYTYAHVVMPADSLFINGEWYHSGDTVDVSFTEMDGVIGNEYGNILIKRYTGPFSSVTRDSLLYRPCPTCSYQFASLIDISDSNELGEIVMVGSDMYYRPCTGLGINCALIYIGPFDQSTSNEYGNSLRSNDSLFYKPCPSCAYSFVSLIDTSNVNEYGNISISNDSLYYRQCPTCSYVYKGMVGSTDSTNYSTYRTAFYRAPLPRYLSEKRETEVNSGNVKVLYYGDSNTAAPNRHHRWVVDYIYQDSSIFWGIGFDGSHIYNSPNGRSKNYDVGVSDVTEAGSLLRSATSMPSGTYINYAPNVNFNGHLGDSLVIYYKGGTGNFSYQINGGSATNVTGAGSGLGIHRIKASGGPSGANTLRINSQTNGFTLYGVALYKSSNKGYVIHKAGTPGMYATELQAKIANTEFQGIVNDMDPDLVFIDLGTNDASLNPSATPQSTADAILESAAYFYGQGRDVVVVAPSLQNQATYYDIRELNAILHDSCVANGYGFINLAVMVGDPAVANTNGVLEDAVHYSEKGGKMKAGWIIDMMDIEKPGSRITTNLNGDVLTVTNGFSTDTATFSQYDEWNDLSNVYSPKDYLNKRVAIGQTTTSNNAALYINSSMGGIGLGQYVAGDAITANLTNFPNGNGLRLNNWNPSASGAVAIDISGTPTAAGFVTGLNFNVSYAAKFQNQFKNSGAGDVALRIEAATADPYINFYGNQDWSIGIDRSSSSRLRIQPQNGVNTITTGMSLETGGDVGIGLVDPSARLHVSGNMKVTTRTAIPSTIGAWSSGDEATQLTAGTGLTISGTQLVNTAPDQTVVLTQGGTTTITGTYPNFIISSSDQYVGTVTSVGLSMPSIFSVSGSPVTSSGTMTTTLASQSANLVFASPNGSAGTPTFRSLVVADLPTLSTSNLSDWPSPTGHGGKYLTTDGTGYSWATVSSGGITSLNGLTAATQTFATGTSGSDFNISSSTSTHTFNLPTASGSVRGALSSADWTTFNSKVGGSGTATRVAFWSGSSTLSSNANLFWDNTNSTLQLANSNAPFAITGWSPSSDGSTAMSVTGSPSATNFVNALYFNTTTTAKLQSTFSNTGPSMADWESTNGDAYLRFGVSGSQYYAIGIDNSDSDKFKLQPYPDLGTGTPNMTMTTGGLFGFNKNSPAYTVDITGTLAVSNVSGTASQLMGRDGSGQLVGVTLGSGFSFISGTINFVETDGSTTNELQTISTSGAAGNITISSGNTLNLNVNDADASTTNEIQTISKSGNTVSLSLSGGSFNIANDTPADGEVLTWSSGNWIASAAASGANIYNSDGTITTGTFREVTIQSSADLYFTDPTGALNFQLNDHLLAAQINDGAGNYSTHVMTTSYNRLGFDTDNYINFNETGGTISLNGSTGTSGYVLKSGGAGTMTWGTQDNIYTIDGTISEGRDVLINGPAYLRIDDNTGNISAEFYGSGTGPQQIEFYVSNDAFTLTNSLRLIESGALLTSGNSQISLAGSTMQIKPNNDAGTSGYVLKSGGSGGSVYWDAASGGVSGSGTANYVTYWSGASAITGESSFYYNPTNNNLGIGTSSPSAGLHINGTGITNSPLYIQNYNTSTSGDAAINITGTPTASGYVNGMNFSVSYANSFQNQFANTGAGNSSVRASANTGDAFVNLNVSGQDWSIGIDNSDSDKLRFQPQNGINTLTTGMALTTSGSLGINTASPSATLHVNGNMIVATTTATPQTIAMLSSSNELTEVGIGTGLSVSGGNLNADITVVNFYPSSSTWNKPTGCKSVTVRMSGGGGGGGSGAYSTGASASGGAGGGAGGFSEQTFDCANISSSVTITVGGGGDPGGGINGFGSPSNGNAGVSGGQSSFGAYLRANGGGGGGAGTTTTSVAGTGGLGTVSDGGTGGTCAATNATGNTGSSGKFASGGGNAGAGTNGSGVGSNNSATTSPTLGTTGSVTRFGSGGSGGGSTSSAGGSGGSYGAGGGGGAAKVSTTSGDGGFGADGFVEVITHF